ncbi:MAG: ORF6N domain-containing protein [Leptospirales bacterium]
MTQKEWDSQRSQIATLKGSGKQSKYLPYAFTQNGIAMLSSVLSSPKAVEVNINIMRFFVKITGLLHDPTEIYSKIQELEKRKRYRYYFFGN